MDKRNTDFRKALRKFKTEVDREIGSQLGILIADAEKNDALVADALRYAKSMALAGGKRIRGALLYCGYRSGGGRDKKKIMRAAAAVELAHLFVLIHDDIIDHGMLRHGVRTLHEKFSRKDHPDRFGESLALIIGDMFYAALNKIILEAGFERGATVRALTQMQKTAIATAIGQTQDIAIGRTRKTTAGEVLAMYANKTARYTFEGPLQVGMILAGCADKKMFSRITRYAIPTGIAFQIRDDILGIFGREEKLGKSVASDMAEGKNTLLVVKARELSSPAQRKRLDSILGKKKPSKKEIAVFRNILLDTGAAACVQKTADRCLAEGKKHIRKALLPEETERFLLGLTEYLEKREF